MCVGVGEGSWTSLTNNLKGNISCLVLEFLLDSLQVWEEHQSIMCSNIVDTSYAHTHKHIYTQTHMKMCVCLNMLIKQQVSLRLVQASKLLFILLSHPLYFFLSTMRPPHSPSSLFIEPVIPISVFLFPPVDPFCFPGIYGYSRLYIKI